MVIFVFRLIAFESLAASRSEVIDERKALGLARAVGEGGADAARKKRRDGFKRERLPGGSLGCLFVQTFNATERGADIDKRKSVRGNGGRARFVAFGEAVENRVAGHGAVLSVNPPRSNAPLPIGKRSRKIANLLESRQKAVSNQFIKPASLSHAISFERRPCR
ncbi:MAG: hypothetical protein KGK01_04260 [Bradyrhizobium sp.]|uniref:hypothetical protein n=1 Tax=Bradyrhizobium sp. TaxID=376 RepID=UPI00239B58D9|nr:hypothetical protein [Bradyrhizobium sp.]MDE2068861.1 hypothetical protein [Bradyrhizobium sp.]MDE2241671.1 hypothetical protein [Bradyrhizobium sp.]MDE2470413.1 hypothetical protein [Bradyrhizobium sp.]